MSIFLCSDQHLGHARIIDLCNRPFSSVEEMNETIIANHNRLVKPNDTVYFLGDVCMGKLADSMPLLHRMNGVKLLILGNHDRPSRCYHHKRGDEARQEWYVKYREYFPMILESIELPLGPDGENVLLHHFPYSDPTYVDHEYEGRYAEFQPGDNGDFLIHGHVHDKWKVKGKQINVGLDVWDFCPVEIAAVQDLMKEQSKGE